MDAVSIFPPEQPFPHFSPHLDPQHEDDVLSLLQSEQQGLSPFMQFASLPQQDFPFL
jgi:hypothetical protein